MSDLLYRRPPTPTLYRVKEKSTHLNAEGNSPLDSKKSISISEPKSILFLEVLMRVTADRKASASSECPKKELLLSDRLVEQHYIYKTYT